MDKQDFVCRNCGGSDLVAWYRVWERQDVSVYRHPEHGLNVNYEGCTSSGDSEEDEEYWCQGCEARVPADQLDTLVIEAEKFVPAAELARMLGNLP